MAAPSTNQATSRFVAALPADSNVHNNSQVLQGVIQQAANAGGGVVEIDWAGSGNVIIDAAITLPSNVIVALMGATLQLAPGAGFIMFSATSKSNCGIIGPGVLDGNGLNVTGSPVGFAFTNCLDLLIQNITCQAFRNVGGHGGSVNGVASRRNHILGCKFATNGGYGFAVGGGRQHLVAECEAYNNGQDTGNQQGFYITGGAQRTSLVGCHAYDDQGAPTQAYGIQEDTSGGLTNYTIVSNFQGGGNTTSDVALVGGNSKQTDLPTAAPNYGTPTTLTNASSPYTVVGTDAFIRANAASGAITVNLPAATGTGRVIVVMKTDSSANVVTVNRNGADTIQGLTSVALPTQYGAVQLTDQASGVWLMDQAGAVAPALSPSLQVTTVNFAASPYTVLATDALIQVNATAGNVAVNLPAATATGRLLIVTKTDSSANTVTVTRAGTDTINGATTYVLSTQYAAVQLADHLAALWSAGPLGANALDLASAQTVTGVKTLQAPVLQGAKLNVTTIGFAQSPYTVLATDEVIAVSTASGAVTINLPAATGSGRAIFIVKTNLDQLAVTLARAGADTINNATTYVIPASSSNSMSSQYGMTLVTDYAAANWTAGPLGGPNVADTIATQLLINKGLFSSGQYSIQFAESGAIASANNLTGWGNPVGGNVFPVTGTTQINLIDSTGFQDGSVIILMFAGALTVKHNQVASSQFLPILLNNGADFTVQADSTLTLVLSTNNGTRKWREIGRKV